MVGRNPTQRKTGGGNCEKPPFPTKPSTTRVILVSLTTLSLTTTWKSTWCCRVCVFVSRGGQPHGNGLLRVPIPHGKSDRHELPFLFRVQGSRLRTAARADVEASHAAEASRAASSRRHRRGRSPLLIIAPPQASSSPLLLTRAGPALCGWPRAPVVVEGILTFLLAEVGVDAPVAR